MRVVSLQYAVLLVCCSLSKVAKTQEECDHVNTDDMLTEEIIVIHCNNSANGQNEVSISYSLPSDLISSVEEFFIGYQCYTGLQDPSSYDQLDLDYNSFTTVTNDSTCVAKGCIKYMKLDRSSVWKRLNNASCHFHTSDPDADQLLITTILMNITTTQTSFLSVTSSQSHTIATLSSASKLSVNSALSTTMQTTILSTNTKTSATSTSPTTSNARVTVIETQAIIGITLCSSLITVLAIITVIVAAACRRRCHVMLLAGKNTKDVTSLDNILPILAFSIPTLSNSPSIKTIYSDPENSSQLSFGKYPSPLVAEVGIAAVDQETRVIICSNKTVDDSRAESTNEETIIVHHTDKESTMKFQLPVATNLPQNSAVVDSGQAPADYLSTPSVGYGSETYSLHSSSVGDLDSSSYIKSIHSDYIQCV